MDDPTPAPFGDVTRLWTHLTDEQREDHAHRIVGHCTGNVEPHVDDPPLDDGRCYSRLVGAAVAGDEIALGWLATSHRPLLLVRGRLLFCHDPSEWGAVCLEALHVTIAQIDLGLGRWLRRRVAQQMGRHVFLATDEHRYSRRHERPTAPAVLRRAQLATPARDPHPQLSRVLAEALDGLDAPTREAFRAIATGEPIFEVADRHELSYDALRQRVCRARRQLKPALAGFVRDVD